MTKRVMCFCSLCGRGGQPVPPATRTLHQQRDAREASTKLAEPVLAGFTHVASAELSPTTLTSPAPNPSIAQSISSLPESTPPTPPPPQNYLYEHDVHHSPNSTPPSPLKDDILEFDPLDLARRLVQEAESRQIYDSLGGAQADGGADEDDNEDEGELPYDEDDDMELDQSDEPEGGGPNAAPRNPADDVPHLIPAPRPGGNSAPGIPLIFCAEHPAEVNEPDPYHTKAHDEGVFPGRTTLDDTHKLTAGKMVFLLVVWLHSQFRLPIRAIRAILQVLALVFLSLRLPYNLDLPKTYATLQKNMGLEPSFSKLVVCPQCHENHPESVKSSICARPGCNTPLFKEPSATAQKQKKRGKPRLVFPFSPLLSQLREILSIPGMEEKMDEWRTKGRMPGEYEDIFDGAVAKEVLGPDNEPFFRNGPNDKEGPNGELRIAVTLGADWFSYARSNLTASHSSAPISFCIANLIPFWRYRTSNMMQAGVMPGPKEQDVNQIHKYFRPLINNLLDLWKHGIKVATPKHPNGRLVRVVLLCCVCDSPAAHKLGGFGAHSHNFFCTRCWIQKRDMQLSEAHHPDHFRRRTNTEHRNLGDEYRALPTAKARKAFVAKNSTRWSEFMRLPYFDMVRGFVVDPMHNLFLGLIKTHFYGIWVSEKYFRPTKELRVLHSFLPETPSYLATLPAMIGEPAGGSLTSDKWLLLCTVFGPVVLPLVYRMFLPTKEAEDRARAARPHVIAGRVRAKAEEKAAVKAVKDAERLAKKLKKEASKGAGQAVKGNGTTSETQALSQPTPATQVGSSTNGVGAIVELPARDVTEETGGQQQQPNTSTSHDEDVTEETTEPEAPNATISPDDLPHFLELSATLKCWMRERITEADIARGAEHLAAYLDGLPKVLKPNHHWSAHTPEFIRDFGPMPGFWTFLFERLNKVLKSFNTSNHGGGELETTFLREFLRMSQVSRLVFEASNSKDLLLQDCASAMLAATANERGTVQGLARELEEKHQDGGILFKLGPGSDYEMTGDAYRTVLRFFQHFPAFSVRSYIDITDPRKPLHTTSISHPWAVLNGKRVTAEAEASSARNSFVEVQFGDHVRLCVIQRILSLDQSHLGINHTLLIAKYYSSVNVEGLWPEDFRSELDIKTWSPEPSPGVVCFDPICLVQHVGVLKTTVGGVQTVVSIGLDRL